MSKKLTEIAPIAIVLGGEAERITQQHRVDRIGQQSVEFEKKCELMAAIKAKHKFSLVILSVEDVLDECDWITLQQVSLLLVIKNQQWNSAKIWARTDSIDYVDTSISEDEWNFRVKRLLPVTEVTSLTLKKLRGLEHDGEFSWGNYRFDLENRRLFHQGFEINLRPREYDVALLLFFNLGEILERSWLQKTIWKRVKTNSRSLDVCIAIIREKLKLREKIYCTYDLSTVKAISLLKSMEGRVI